MKGTHSNDYCITHFNSCQHSKIALEQSVEILYVLSFAKHLSPVVYITAVGDVTLKWFDSNGLKMNSNKTQCILFATPNFNKRTDVSNNN